MLFNVQVLCACQGVFFCLSQGWKGLVVVFLQALNYMEGALVTELDLLGL